jgi:L-lactate permease
MTEPVNLTDLVPSKAKTWVGLVGSVLTFVVPLIVSVEDYLPSPWPGVIGAVLAVLTALGVYKAPYQPTDTVLAPDTPAVAAAARQAPPSAGGHQSPWKK